MIEVGDTFEIAEVLDNIGYGHLTGKQGIIVKSNRYLGFDFKEFRSASGEDPYLYKEEVKPIGRLKVTKLK